jgi:hypothetical protein
MVIKLSIAILAVIAATLVLVTSVTAFHTLSPFLRDPDVQYWMRITQPALIVAVIGAILARARRVGWRNFYDPDI